MFFPSELSTENQSFQQWAIHLKLGHLETHTRSQTPHFMSHPMDMTWILQHQVYFLAKWHIHVISMSYLFSKKIYLDIPGISRIKKIAFGIYLVYLFMSYAMPIRVLSMS